MYICINVYMYIHIYIYTYQFYQFHLREVFPGFISAGRFGRLLIFVISFILC